MEQSPNRSSLGFAVGYLLWSETRHAAAVLNPCAVHQPIIQNHLQPFPRNNYSFVIVACESVVGAEQIVEDQAAAVIPRRFAYDVEKRFQLKRIRRVDDADLLRFSSCDGCCEFVGPSVLALALGLVAVFVVPLHAPVVHSVAQSEQCK